MPVASRAAGALVCLGALVVVLILLPARPAGAGEAAAWDIYLGLPEPVSSVKLVGGRPSGCLHFDVEPENTRIYVNGLLVGKVSQYDGWPDKLYLPEGRYRLRLNGPRGHAWRGEVTVLAYHQISIGQKGP